MPGAWGRDDWSHVGPMARSVADCALVTDLVSGHHPRDHFSLRQPSAVDIPQPAVRGKRLAVSLDLGDWPVTERCATRVRRGTRARGRRGHRRARGPHDRARAGASGEQLAQRGACSRRACAVRSPAARTRSTLRAGLARRAGRRTRPRHRSSRGGRLEGVVSERVDRVLVDYDALLCPAMCHARLRRRRRLHE